MKNDKPKGFGLGVVSGEEVTRKMKVSLSRFVQMSQHCVSGDEVVSLPPGSGRYLPHGTFISCFQVRRARWGGQSDLLLLLFSQTPSV